MIQRSAAGRLFFGIALAVFGLEPLVTGHLPGGLLPLSSPLNPWVAGCIGILFSAVAVAAMLKPASPGPYLLAAFLVIALFTTHLPKLVASPRSGGLWAGAFEVVAFLGGAFLLVRPTIGRIVLGISFAVFGMQHFMYAQYVATLIPTWIPARLFWTYAVGVAFFATALSFILNRATRLSGTLLGAMYLTWVVILHLPRAIAASGSEPEWTSLFVALGFTGMGLIVAGLSNETS